MSNDEIRAILDRQALYDTRRAFAIYRVQNWLKMVLVLSSATAIAVNTVSAEIPYGELITDLTNALALLIGTFLAAWTLDFKYRKPDDDVS